MSCFVCFIIWTRGSVGEGKKGKSGQPHDGACDWPPYHFLLSKKCACMLLLGDTEE